MGTDKVVDTNLLMQDRGTLTTIFSIIEYPKALKRELDILWPQKTDYIKAIEVMIKLLDIGKPVPAIDILIASMCINRELVLSTQDKHFKHIQDIAPELRLEVV